MLFKVTPLQAKIPDFTSGIFLHKIYKRHVYLQRMCFLVLFILGIIADKEVKYVRTFKMGKYKE